MALGENILATAEDRTDLDFTGFGFTIETIQCSVRYLREKHEQWFGDYDEDGVREAFDIILNAPETSA